GHGELHSMERARALRALAVADPASRQEWIEIAAASGTVIDQNHILHWAAATFGWPCDPPTLDTLDNRDAITSFQRSYNADFAVGLFAESGVGRIAVDGVMAPDTWGAVFDCYVRALRPVAPVPATYPIGDESTRTGRNGGRPTGQYPFVVLGTNGP